jgi:hypothetical protein
MLHLKRLIAIALALVAIGGTANAQATRTWVSGVGDDANPCSRTAPCKTFQGAISKTAAGGEIDVLDAGGFGGLTITKSIRIDGTPFTAGVLVTNTDGITINAGVNDVVVLRGLTVNGTQASTLGQGTTKGIKFLVGRSLVIENCEIYGFGLRAISIEPTAASSVATVMIADSVVHANSWNGIVAQPAGGAQVSMTLDRVRISHNGQNGVLGFAGTLITARNSVISYNLGSGVKVDGTNGGTTLDLDGVMINDNQKGITVITPAQATARINDTTIVKNVVGLDGNVYSFGNNRIQGNTSGNGPAFGSLPLQ